MCLNVYFAGSEMLGPVNVGLNTTYSFVSKNIAPGEHYYTTVYAYNHLHMVSRSTSRGIVVDTEAPIAGTVYTNSNYQNRHFHGSMFSASWNGFYDKHSFVKEYLYKISPCDTNGTVGYFINNGISSKFEIPTDNFPEGVKMCLLVYAKDAAGHSSETVMAEPFVIDKTAPIALTCSNYKRALNHKLTCNCDGILEGHHTDRCTCSNQETMSLFANSLYKVTITLEYPLEVKAQLEIGADVGEVYFQRTGYKRYEYERSFFSYEEEEVHPVIHFLRQNTVDTPSSFTLVFRRCSDFEERKSGSLTSSLRVTQSGMSKLHVSFTTADMESYVSKIQVY